MTLTIRHDWTDFSLALAFTIAALLMASGRPGRGLVWGLGTAALMYAVLAFELPGWGVAALVLLGAVFLFGGVSLTRHAPQEPGSRQRILPALLSIVLLGIVSVILVGAMA